MLGWGVIKIISKLHADECSEHWGNNSACFLWPVLRVCSRACRPWNTLRSRSLARSCQKIRNKKLIKIWKQKIAYSSGFQTVWHKMAPIPNIKVFPVLYFQDITLFSELWETLFGILKNRNNRLAQKYIKKATGERKSQEIHIEFAVGFKILFD